MSAKTTIISVFIIICIAVSYYYRNSIYQVVDPLYTPNDPVAVANDYWLVYLSSTAENASKYTIESSGDDWLTNKDPHDRAILGDNTNNDGTYFITTDLILNRNGRKSIPMYTVVSSVDGQFKVDEYATFNSIHDAALSRFMDRYTQSLKNGSEYLRGDIVSQLDKEQFLSLTKVNLKTRLCETALEVVKRIDTASENIDYCLEE